MSFSATTTFPAEAASASRARRFADEVLGRHGCEAVADTVTLLVSELVTNAVLHARSSARLSVEGDDRCVRVAVADGSHDPLRPRTASPSSSTGRGLLLVDALATAWGCEADGVGKVTWFTIAVDGTARGVGAPGAA